MPLGNLAQRVLVAVVAVPLLLLLLHYHRPEPTWAVIFLASLLAMREFFGMTLPEQDRMPALVMGAIASAAFYWLDPHTADYAPQSRPLIGAIFAGSTMSFAAAPSVREAPLNQPTSRAHTMADMFNFTFNSLRDT